MFAIKLICFHYKAQGRKLRLSQHLILFLEEKKLLVHKSIQRYVFFLLQYTKYNVAYPCKVLVLVQKSKIIIKNLVADLSVSLKFRTF